MQMQEKAREKQMEMLSQEPRMSLGESNPVNTLILDSRPEELWENTFLLYERFSVWYFVTEALKTVRGATDISVSNAII